jgi:RNA polymerase sigma-70 factor (ECF subfamily)
MMAQPEALQHSQGAGSGALDRLRELLVDDFDAGFGLLVTSYSSLVYSLALRLTGCHAEADDLSQETFLRAYKALLNFPPERCRELKPGPWLATIGTNLWRNHVRDRRRAPSTAVSYDSDQHDVIEPGPGPEQFAIASEGWKDLASLLTMLPERYRAPVVLRHVIGLSYQELSRVLNCPVGTAKAQTSRGIAALRALLGERVPRGAPVPAPTDEDRAESPRDARDALERPRRALSRQ